MKTNFERRFKSHHDTKNAIRQYSKAIPIDYNQFIERLHNAELDYDLEHTIYVHVPFCDRICSFCNLNRKLVDHNQETYTNYLLKQMIQYSNIEQIRKLKIGSIYFGGGTPTTLEVSQLVQVIEAIKSRFNVTEDLEITIETTLHNLRIEEITKLVKAGVNRLSIGIQTFNDHGRKYLNRTYKQKEVIERIHAIRKHFDGVLSIDKIYNYHNEDIEDLKEDIYWIKNLDVDSVSFYSLMIHSGSYLSKSDQYKNVNDETDQLYHHNFLNEMLKDGDYEVLELTKVRKGKKDQYKYISTRNNGGYTIPIGTGAGGNIGPFNIMNISKERTMIVVETNHWIKKVNYIYGKMQNGKFSFRENRLSSHELEWLKKELEFYIEEGFITKQKDDYEYTLDGIFYGNNISASIMRKFLDTYCLD